MALLDVNAVVALAWDSHVHHASVRAWFTQRGSAVWATCPLTESGFIRVSSNPKLLPSPIGIADAVGVVRSLRALPGHVFLTDDVSVADPDFPALHGYRQVSHAHLLTLARRHQMPLVTFDSAIAGLGDGSEVELLAAL